MTELTVRRPLHATGRALAVVALVIATPMCSALLVVTLALGLNQTGWIPGSLAVAVLFALTGVLSRVSENARIVALAGFGLASLTVAGFYALMLLTPNDRMRSDPATYLYPHVAAGVVLAVALGLAAWAVLRARRAVVAAAIAAAVAALGVALYLYESLPAAAGL